MTKADIAYNVGLRCTLRPERAREVLEACLDEMKQALRRGEHVMLHGFGHLQRRTRKPFTGRNPKTGEAIDVPAKHWIHFRPLQELKIWKA